MSRKRKISLKGTLRRFRIWQETGRRAYRRTDAMAEEHKCLNCETVFRGNYCPVCGQSAREKRLSFADIFSNLMGIILNMEKGFLYTVLCLILRPGYMIRDYISGHRIRYTRPIQLLFILATISIAVNYLSGNSFDANSMEVKIMPQALHDSLPLTTLYDSLANFDESKMTNFLSIDYESDSESDKAMAEKMEHSIVSVIQWITDNLGLATLLFLPFLVLPMFLSFRKTKAGGSLCLTEYFFVTIYICDQWLLLHLIAYPLPSSTLFMLLFFPIVFIYDCRQLFRISWGDSVVRTMLFSFLSVVEMLLLSLGLACLIELFIE